MSFECCWNCKDRTVEPNCHTTCEKYLKEKESDQKIKEEKRYFNEINSHFVNKRRNKKW